MTAGLYVTQKSFECKTKKTVVDVLKTVSSSTSPLYCIVFFVRSGLPRDTWSQTLESHSVYMFSVYFMCMFCSIVCVVFLPSLVEVEEEEKFISEAGELMRGGEGSRRGEKGGTGAQIWDQRVHSLVERQRGEEGGREQWTYRQAKAV